MLKVLSNDAIRQIHNSSLEILERTGIKSTSERIANVLLDGGAEKGSDGNIRVPGYLVEESIKKAPKFVVLCGRNHDRDIVVEDTRVYYGLGGSPIPYIVDFRSGNLRSPKKTDVEEAVKVGDALPNLTFMMTLAGAYDEPYGQSPLHYLHELEMLLKNTTKPIIYSEPGPSIARRAIQMASAVLGGLEEYKKRPLLCPYVESVSPLTFGPDNESMIESAQIGVPIVFAPAPMPGFTAPMTISATQLIGNCENLVAITISQLVNPGTPIVIGTHTGAVDLKSLRYQFASPELGLGWMASAQIAQYYRLPSFGQGGCADSKCPDAQAGAEAMMTALTGALGGVNLNHNCGTVAMGGAGSMEMAIIDDEIAGYVYRILKGVDTSDHALAVDLIEEVGPGGSFMGKKHTLEYVQKGEFYISKLFDKQGEKTWMQDGERDIRKVSQEKISKILKEHNPEPIPDEADAKISQILKETETELINRPPRSSE